MQAPRIKLAADALERETEKLEALFESIGAGIVATDEHGNATRINRIALELLGYEEHEVIGRRFTDTFVSLHEDGTIMELMDRPIVKAFLTGTTVNDRVLYKKKDGSILPAQVTISPIELHGHPVGAIEVFRDITLDIESDKMKSDFISLASHQLRTPLSSINIYSRMLRDGLGGKLNRQQQSFVDTILVSVDRMNELIDMLLNITRIEAGGIDVRAHKVQIGDIISELVAGVRPKARKKGIHLHTIIKKDLPMIKTDELLVREVCSNLVSNAIKYTPRGGEVVIMLAVYHQNRILVSVEDTGYGIPKEAQEKIFTKFFRANNAVAHDSSGTGLGLYLTKSVVDALDGDIWFTSTEGKGSTFYFTLPLRGSLSKAGRFKPGTYH